jgi:hypothetical protein
MDELLERATRQALSVSEQRELVMEIRRLQFEVARMQYAVTGLSAVARKERV